MRSQPALSANPEAVNADGLVGKDNFDNRVISQQQFAVLAILHDRSRAYTGRSRRGRAVLHRPEDPNELQAAPASRLRTNAEIDVP